jgi:hypothetical protein
MADLPQKTVDDALAGLGNYRVRAAQELAAEGSADEFSGALLLALGLRETGLRNINNSAETDHGVVQISELYHAPWLASEPGCRAGSWTPVPGRSALENGYCPRYTTAIAYALKMLKANMAYAVTKGIEEADRLRFAISAYNAGIGGAWSGFRAGDVDKYTTGSDYSAWVLRHRAKINSFLSAHPNWQL